MSCKTDILLSVLIPSVPERLKFLTHKINDITAQIGKEPVELLVFIDNKRRTTGRKRNELLDLAKGKFVVFVDDDDTLSNDYIASLLTAIRGNPSTDCIVFDVMYNDTKIKKQTLVKYGLEYPHGFDKENKMYTRKPNHLMCYLRTLANSVRYNDSSYGEDDVWGRQASQKITNQVRIDKVLYTYDYVIKLPSWYAK